jgi:hypothetical protein
MSKSKSQFVENLDVIQTAVHSFLKPLGFHKKGRTHNRHTEGGLVHVVNFQMGYYPPGQSSVDPDLQWSLYGKFAVNLGVLLPCIFEIEHQRSSADFVKEYYCTIRGRLEVLAYGKDKWFDLRENTTVLTTRVVEMLDRFGLDFLEQFQSYSDALSYYSAHGNLPSQNSGRASLEMALVAHHVGDPDLSTKLFAKAYASRHTGFRDHVAELARRIGHRVA